MSIRIPLSVSLSLSMHIFIPTCIHAYTHTRTSLPTIMKIDTVASQPPTLAPQSLPPSSIDSSHSSSIPRLPRQIVPTSKQKSADQGDPAPICRMHDHDDQHARLSGRIPTSIVHACMALATPGVGISKLQLPPLSLQGDAGAALRMAGRRRWYRCADQAAHGKHGKRRI